MSREEEEEEERGSKLFRWPEANDQKQDLEERQRKKRKEREAMIERAMERGTVDFADTAGKVVLTGERIAEVEPTWFEKIQDELTQSVIHVYKGEYWNKKEAQDWSKCPDIY